MHRVIRHDTHSDGRKLELAQTAPHHFQLFITEPGSFERLTFGASHQNIANEQFNVVMEDSDNHGRCAECEDVVHLNALKSVSGCWVCTDCIDNPPMCSHCSGSGEGQYDGSHCRACGGSGVVRYDIGEEYDYDDE